MKHADGKHGKKSDFTLTYYKVKFDPFCSSKYILNIIHLAWSLISFNTKVNQNTYTRRYRC